VWPERPKYDLPRWFEREVIYPDQATQPAKARGAQHLPRTACGRTSVLIEPGAAAPFLATQVW